MIKKKVSVISDFGGGQDTRTPIAYLPLNRSPNMRNFHCAGIGNRLIKRGGFSKVNSTAVESDNLDVFYPPGYQVGDHKLRDVAANTEISMGFKPNTTGTVTKVRLWLKKVGTPGGTDTVTLEIHTDSSGVPSGSVVTNGTATAVDISDTITTSYAWVTFSFSTAPSLTAGTQYHLVLTGAFTIDASNYVAWGEDTYDIVYPDGAMSIYDGTTWTVESSMSDAIFEVYITSGAKGNDGFALFDFSSKNMLLGIWGAHLYKMDKNSSGAPDGTWDAISGASPEWDTNTKLMLHCDGSDTATTFTDEIGKTVTANGDAQIDTAQKVFGTASGLFDGTGDYLSSDDHADWFFDTGDLTIDFRVRFAAVGDAMFYQQKVDASNRIQLFYENSSNRLFFLAQQTSDVFQARISWTPSQDTWYHVAVVRSGSTIYMFINGVSQSVTEDTAIGSSSIPDLAAAINIGGDSVAGSHYLNGWLDEYRISKGIARWTANFTPPTAAYAAGSIAISSSRFWTFADWQSGTALINSDIGLYQYTGSGNATVVSAAPVGKFLIIWKNYAFIAGIRGSPNNIRYSDLSDYTTWPTGNSLSNQFDTNDGDVITGIRILKGKMYVFKRYAIFRVTYIGSNPTFQVDEIYGIGTPSHYSIKEMDMGGDVGRVLCFLTTEKKLAVFDGYNVQIINENLAEETNDLFQSSDDQPISLSDMNLNYIDFFHAVAETDTSEYILYSVLGSDTSVAYAFVFDSRTGGVFPYDGQIFASSVHAVAENKLKKVFCAGYTGYLWEMESGNSDDGSSINAYWVSTRIKPGAVSLLNKLLQLAMHFKEVSSGSTLNWNVQYRLDWNTAFTTAETTNYDRNDEYAFGKTALLDIGTIEDMFQIKIKDNSTNPAGTLYGFDLYGEPLGVGVGDRATS